MRTRALALSTAVLLALATGCGSGDDSAPKTKDGLTTITVGLSASANSISGYLAAQKFAKDANLKLKIVTINSGSEAIPLLLNGKLDVSLGDALATMSASTNGVPLTALSVAAIGPSDPEKDASGIFTADQKLTIAGLAGKKVGVPALKGAPELIARAGIDAAGGDSSKVTFVELAHQGTIASMQNGDVAAGLLQEPFTSQASQEGLKELTRPLASAFAGLPVTLWISSQRFAKEHPDLVKKFVGVAAQADNAAGSDTDLARTTAKSFMDMDPAILDTIRMPSFVTEPVDTKSALEKLIALANKYKFLPKQPDLDTLVAAPASS